MARFSRTTILELVEALNFSAHASIDEFLFKFGLDDVPQGGGLRPRRMAIAKHLFEHQDDPGPCGASMAVEAIDYLLETRIRARPDWMGGTPDPNEKFAKLLHSLERDGYVVRDAQLKALVPEDLGLAEMEDELTHLLEKFGFDTAKGHFEQARAAHTRGDWAAANAQIRTFFESLFDAIAEKLSDPASSLPSTSHARREFLSTTRPPFLSPDLNEWDPAGKGFVQGLWKRLNPAGSHPGLSDEDDSTFRLHIVFLVGSHYLKRLRARLGA